MLITSQTKRIGVKIANAIIQSASEGRYKRGWRTVRGKNSNRPRAK